MKKVFYLFFILMGCNQVSIDTKKVILHKYVIRKGICRFDIYGKSSPNDIGDRTSTSVYFVDSCYKYEVGDTVKFIKQ